MNCISAQYTTIPDQKVNPAYVIEGGLPLATPSLSEVHSCRLRTYGGSFLKACGLVVLVFLCHLLMGNINVRRRGIEIPAIHVAGWDGHVNYWPSLPRKVILSHCADWGETQAQQQTAGPYTNSLSFEFDDASDFYYFLSRGPSSSGTIEIVHSDEAGTKIRVNIVVEYDDMDALNQVCLIDGLIQNLNAAGIAILSWDQPLEGLHMNFIVVVEIPATSDGSPYQIKDLRTDMPIFTHNVGDLNTTVYFESISLNTTDEPISVLSLSAGYANITTTNAAIEGSFNISSSLTLSTINAQMKAEVGLHHDGRAREPTELIAENTNALIETSVSLYSSKEDNTGGQFKVSAVNANSAVTIDFPTTPVDSILSLDATTSLGVATVTLDTTYEGTFAFSTTVKKPTLNYSKNVPDPAGRGRQREVTILSESGGDIDGTVAWVSPNANLDKLAAGSATLRTTLSEVVLNL